MISFSFSARSVCWCAPLRTFLTCVCFFLRYHWQHHGRSEAGGSCDRRWHQWWTGIKESWCWIRNGEYFFPLTALAVFLDQPQHLQISSSPLLIVSFTVLFSLRQCGCAVPPSGFLSSHNIPAVLCYTIHNFVFKVVLFLICLFVALWWKYFKSLCFTM